MSQIEDAWNRFTLDDLEVMAMWVYGDAQDRAILQRIFAAGWAMALGACTLPNKDLPRPLVAEVPIRPGSLPAYNPYEPVKVFSILSGGPVDAAIEREQAKRELFEAKPPIAEGK